MVKSENYSLPLLYLHSLSRHLYACLIYCQNPNAVKYFLLLEYRNVPNGYAHVYNMHPTYDIQIDEKALYQCIMLRLLSQNSNQRDKMHVLNRASPHT